MNIQHFNRNQDSLFNSMSESDSKLEIIMLTLALLKNDFIFLLDIDCFCNQQAFVFDS